MKNMKNMKIIPIINNPNIITSQNISTHNLQKNKLMIILEIVNIILSNVIKRLRLMLMG